MNFKEFIWSKFINKFQHKLIHANISSQIKEFVKYFHFIAAQIIEIYINVN